MLNQLPLQFINIFELMSSCRLVGGRQYMFEDLVIESKYKFE